MITIKIELEEKICEVLDEIQEIKLKHGLSNKQLFQVATEETREEYFIKFLELLQEIVK